MEKEQNDQRPSKFRKPKRVQRNIQEEWMPKTDLGHLVKNQKITIDQIFRHSLKIREDGIVDFLFGENLKQSIISVKSVQKQTKAGQKIRLKVCVVVGDGVNHVGIGVRSAVDVATATRAALKSAKCNIKQIKLGYWGNEVGKPHTVQVQAAGKCGSVNVIVYPGRKGTNLVTGSKVRKIFELAGIKDINTRTYGKTRTTENFAKASLQAIENSSNFQTPELWEPQVNDLNPLLEHAMFLDSVRTKRID